MVENETVGDETALQRNVEKDLFEEQNKILDRFYTLLTLSIVTGGFTFTILTFMFGRSNPNVREILLTYNVAFTFLCIFGAFFISIINILSTFHHRKLVNKGGIIGYREDDELVNNNLKLYRAIARQKNYYVIAITLIGLGISYFFNQFSQHRVLSIGVTAGFVLVVMFLIRNSRRYLS